MGEIIAIPIFNFIRKKFDKQHYNNYTFSFLKGVLERFIIFLGLVTSIPSIITLFGALKLGTRLKENQESKLSNDYFLVGNLTSVLFAVLEFLFFTFLYDSIYK